MFELFNYIRDYQSNPACTQCSSNQDTYRMYDVDCKTQFSSVKKSDSELKTLGDLAMRNTERMSDDQKTELYLKHNSYKEDVSESKPLPKGMSYMKKQPKPLWPGSSGSKKKRKPK